MSRRALHLASVLLLLASLSSAEGAGLRKVESTLGGHYLVVLLAQDHAASCAMASAAPGSGNKLELSLPAASMSHSRAVWTMRPPSAHSALLHEVTGSSL